VRQPAGAGGRIVSPIVDAHTHLGLESFIVRLVSEEKRKKPAFRDSMENRIERLIERMDANGVAQAVAFPFPLEEIDAARANAYVIEAHGAFPHRIHPFALIGDDVEHWLGQGARGFKQHAILQNPDRFDLGRAYRAMAEAQAPLIIHPRSQPGFPSVVDQIRRILGVAPTLKVIVAHMGRRTPNTSEGVVENLRGLRDEPGVYVETSTVRDARAIECAVELLGEDRVLFGSDFPFNSHLDADPLAVELEILSRAHLPLGVREKVLGTNVLTCLGIQTRV